LFKGHYQPRIPGELGFYDLRLPETREAQARLAFEHGVEGFCYWHYWLGHGRRMLNLPFDRILESGEPRFPFCLGWANHDWKGVFFGANRRVLAAQEYPGEEDHRLHFEKVLTAFRDQRYIRVNGMPLFLIYRPSEIPHFREFIMLWRQLAENAGIGDIYFVGEGVAVADREKFGLNAVSYTRHRQIEQMGQTRNLVRKAIRRLTGITPDMRVYPYAEALKYFLKDGPMVPGEIPSIVPGWDTTARLGRDATILHESTPERFRVHVRETLERCAACARSAQENIVFVKSWNEWAEGNYLEPDRTFGRGFLEVLRDEMDRSS
jgi:hypothetical protein